jgi:hypothetical protein
MWTIGTASVMNKAAWAERAMTSLTDGMRMVSLDDTARTRLQVA